MSTKPTHEQIKAVRAVLYKHERLKQLSDLASEIATVMNLNPAAPLATNDVRNPPGSGPQWFLPATGAIDPLVLRGAELCDEIASTLLAMRDDVEKVTFPQSDREHLTAALAAEAASWTARGAVWRAPEEPDVESATQTISGHVEQAITEARYVQEYLETRHEVGL